MPLSSARIPSERSALTRPRGKIFLAKFVDNELKIIDLVKNTEVIYYMYNDDDELLGIDKTICSAIRITMANNDVEDLTFFTNPDGDIFPEKDLPENSRILKGFVWRGDERILTKDDIFDEDDNHIELAVIKGIDNPIDIDAVEEERDKNANDPVNNIPSDQPESEQQKPQQDRKTSQVYDPRLKR